jgi:hypothetical protein
VQFAKHLGLALGGMNGWQDHVELELFVRLSGAPSGGEWWCRMRWNFVQFVWRTHLLQIAPAH